jgi:hypothetical protein
MFTWRTRSGPSWPILSRGRLGDAHAERRLHWKGLAMSVLPVRGGAGERTGPVMAQGARFSWHVRCIACVRCHLR